MLPGGGAAAPQPGQRLTVLYGSQTGNARREAEKLVQAAEAAGLAVRLVRTDAYQTRELASERLLYVVISTGAKAIRRTTRSASPNSCWASAPRSCRS